MSSDKRLNDMLAAIRQRSDHLVTRLLREAQQRNAPSRTSGPTTHVRGMRERDP